MSNKEKKNFYVRTFGCQMNELDSSKMKLLLAHLGYEETLVPEQADIIIYNTCTIREKAHHKAMSEIGRSRFYKAKNRELLIAVCGCVAAQDKETLLQRYPYLDLLFGPDQISKLPELIQNRQKSGKTSIALDLVDDPLSYVFVDNIPKNNGEIAPSSFVSIMKGCNCACSYCIVPKVRGREVSRCASEIIDEVGRLSRLGTKEVVLLGQNVNAYLDKSSGTAFSSLIKRVVKETGISRIRFMSPHPRDVGEDIIREYAENEKLMPHIHLPMQAGSNSVLKKMRRGYTRERYLEIALELRNARPNMAISTDIIVGFCGETDADFEGTVGMLETVGFDSIFAFKYSPRPGTEAAKKFEDDVPADVKDARLTKVLETQKAISMTRNRSCVGKMGNALALGVDKMRKGLITGRLEDNRLVHFDATRDVIGSIVNLRITEAHLNSLAGEVV